MRFVDFADLKRCTWKKAERLLQESDLRTWFNAEDEVCLRIRLDVIWPESVIIAKKDGQYYHGSDTQQLPTMLITPAGAFAELDSFQLFRVDGDLCFGKQKSYGGATVVYELFGKVINRDRYYGKYFDSVVHCVESH